MWSGLISPIPPNDDDLVAALWEAGTAGIVHEFGGMRAFFHDSITPEAVESAFAAFEFVSLRREPTEPDITFAGQNCDGILAGKRFFIVPGWVKSATPPGRLRLQIDSPTAFGTGSHESTQLCLRALERSDADNADVLDIGCGSGILSSAARLLGAKSVVSCDIHSEAVQTARHHGNDFIFQGSVDAVSSSSRDIVLANIGPRVLDLLAGELRRVGRLNSHFILAGFITGKEPARFQPHTVLEQDGWLCWVCTRDGILSGKDDVEQRDLSYPADWWL